MYLENMYQARNKREEAISQSKSLFRPWDSEKECLKNYGVKSETKSVEKSSRVHQDSTVSTTVSERVIPNSTSTIHNDKDCFKSPRKKNNHSSQKSKNTVTNSCSSTKSVPEVKNTSTPSQSGFYPVIKSESNPVDSKVPVLPDNIVLSGDCCNIMDPFSMYPDFVQNNFVNTLGISPNDPLLFESLAQGYALEEYARVLTQEQQAKLLNNKKQRPKKYKCPHCDVGFSNNGQLKGHIRIHTGERPFKCDEKECGKTFTRNEELTRHKRIHSGLRPYPCTHCGKRFGRKDHLKKHSRTHYQPRGLYAVPVVLPFEAWASAQPAAYPYLPMYGY